MRLGTGLGALALALWASVALAAEKPAELKIGITTYASGPASVFGVPARSAAEMLAEQINARGGIQGVPVSLNFVDEGAGVETLTSEYRRLVDQVGVDVMFASISSGVCNNVAPLAEDLEVLNFMWDCGTQRIFEEEDYDWVYRTQANATPEILAPLLYLLETRPDFKTVAVVNQDYAWGRDSWNIFSTALKTLKPDVEIVAELFPAFGAPDYSAEVSRLQALAPDVILSTSWGGDLDTFVRQANQRGLFANSQFVLPLAESSLERLGADLPEGVIVGARGDHYFLHPERRGDEDFKAFTEGFRKRTGAWPIYSAFHMAQAFAALEAVYDKATKANGGEWPDHEQVREAMDGLEFRGFGRPLKIREDNQGVEAQLVGVTVSDPAYPFRVIDKMEIYPAEPIMAPAGEESIEWIKTLKPDFLATRGDRFDHAR
ncbi:ABC transporter substrate-binding protein [Aurantimonas sp. Leaf443]|uniref:ABC transporter substrate-binding protein n=1 Tax=Aurantimonas sp. Leaf443 TaxID=1736378 RepID=UPI0006F372A7|nr:ABC transporter substrate-binding protein [Aurantimonas sp. Leaf443]KQT85249.1 branched-chain amino acid ABC transporter substrate-binding protein [Aurantimonas sp. Leaf443]